MSAIQRVPAATLLLVAANLAAAFGLLLRPEWVAEFGFVPQSPSATDAVASLFLHQNLIHLLGNMMFLAAVGPAVEFATGAARFLAIYVVGGIVGVLTHWIFSLHGAGDLPLIGASGAIAACTAFYSVRYANLRVPVLPNVSVSILAVVGLWAALQAVGAFVRLGGDQPSSAAYWAHLGGLAAGLLMSLFFQAPRLASVQFGHEVLDRMNQRSPAAAAAAAESHLERHPDDLAALRKLAAAHRNLGEPTEEARALLRALELAEPAEAVDEVRRLGELGQWQTLPPLRRMRWAEALRETAPDVAAGLLRSVVAEPDEEPQKPDAMLALAERLKPENPEEASALAQRLLREYPLHPAADLARARGWSL